MSGDEAAKRQPGTLEGPRPPRLAEHDALLDMVNTIFRTSRGQAPTIGRDWAHVYTADNLANVSVIFDAGKPVASTGVWANDVVIGDVQVRVGGINTVGTLPDYRLRGLGSQVVLAAHQTMRDLGCLVGLLSTGIADWYRRLGWEEAGIVRSYGLDRASAERLPPLAAGEQMRLVDWQEQDSPLDDLLGDLLDGLLEIYAQERLGGRRTPALLADLLTARQVQQIALAEANGKPLAYFFLQRGQIVEWAGPAASVAGLVRAYVESSAFETSTLETSTVQRDDAASLTLVAPGWAHPLVTLLDGAGVPFTTRHLGMLYLVDPQALLEAYGVTAVRLEAAGDTYVLHSSQANTSPSGAPLTLDRRQLTRLFFGSTQASEGAQPFEGLFPLPFWQRYLEKV